MSSVETRRSPLGLPAHTNAEMVCKIQLRCYYSTWRINTISFFGDAGAMSWLKSTISVLFHISSCACSTAITMVAANMFSKFDQLPHVYDEIWLKFWVDMILWSQLSLLSRMQAETGRVHLQTGQRAGWDMWLLPLFSISSTEIHDPQVASVARRWST